MTVITEDASAPDYVSPAYREMRERWQFVRRIRNLNESIREEPGAVLPRAEAEGKNNYATRCNLTVGFQALDETIHGLTGLATRHDPDLKDDVPERIVSEWEDIDLQGTHGAIFVQHCLDHALQDGHGAILVDHPKAPEGLTLAEEQALGLRAYFVLVPIDRITAWRIGRVFGRLVITMVKIREDQERPTGEFGTTLVERYRTLYQRWDESGRKWVEFVVHEKVKADGKESWVIVDSGTIKGPEWIPFHPFYGGERQGVLKSLPPLRGLAWSNLEHTQKKSQRAYSMYKTAIAIPVWVNRVGALDAQGEPSPVKLSSDTGIDVGENGNAFFMEGQGAALAPLREDCLDLERLMGSQGFSMLRRDGGSEKTATEHEMQSTREESKLARAVRSVNDAVESGFSSMAAFYGIRDADGNPAGGSVEMERSFSDIFLSADEMRFLSELETEGKLTLETLLSQLQAGGRILKGVDLEQEAEQVRRDRAEEPLDIKPLPDEQPPEDPEGEPEPVAKAA